MTERLEPFDPAASCPKCGFAEISMFYVAHKDTMNLCWLDRCPLHEHMHRKCRTCGYIWLSEIAPTAGTEVDRRSPELT